MSKKNGQSGEDSSHHARETRAQELEPGDASRRRFVLGSAAISLGAGLGLAGCGGGHEEGGQRFGYGVASGDPLADRVILWTRVNVSSPADVQWEVATDATFANVVRSGTASTSEARDYTVKVDVTGLQPGTSYAYRFHHGGETSAVGSTRTLPVGQPQRVRLAVFSCAAYALGQFHAYADAVNRGDFDVAVFLGDYIYENGLTNAEQLAAAAIGREIDPRGELHTLSEYRQRYARYHTDADLRALRATMPLIAVWDDHEIANEIWRGGVGGTTGGDFVERRRLTGDGGKLRLRPAGRLPHPLDPKDLFRRDLAAPQELGRGRAGGQRHHRHLKPGEHPAEEGRDEDDVAAGGGDVARRLADFAAH